MRRSFPTVQSRLVRFLNVAGRGYARHVTLDVDHILERARSSAGLDDFGGTGFLDPLRVLLEAHDKEARLHFVGRKLVQIGAQRSLVNRLRIQHYLRAFPEAAKTPVPSPVVIVGVPRSGTTLLHRLLGADPTNRVLRAWELYSPAPPLGPDGKSHDTRRDEVLRARKVANALVISPEGRRRLEAIHESEPDSAEECWLLLQNSFLCDVNSLFAHIPSYSSYLAGEDFTASYRHYRKQLRVLTATQPAERLVVKYPGHLGHLNELFAVFPGARVIWCHRDLADVIPSTCSLAAAQRSLRSDELDAREIGQWALGNAQQLISRGMCARNQLDSQSFFDVDYGELTADPLGMVRRIYQFLNFTLTEETEGCFTDWLDENRQRRQDLHHTYSHETFGLDPAQIDSLFGDYYDAFDVTVETKRR